MKRIISILLLLLTVWSNAQVKFEEGYIITSDNTKKQVLIKNIDWLNSPSEFIYKIDNQSNEIKGNPATIKEYRVNGFPKYVSYIGIIDTSPSHLSSLSNKYEPETQEVSTFLKEVTSGDKNLYSYHGSKNSGIYFYSDSDDSEIKALTYKKYHPEGNDSKVATNDTYLQQLKNIFNNDSKTSSMISKTKYTEGSMMKIFKAHNSQISGNVEEKSSVVKNKSLNFNLNLRPGVNFYSPLKTTYFIGNNEFPSQTNYRIGIEAELILPFNKYKWAVLFEPTYSSYNSKKMIAPTGSDLYNMSMENYSFINLPIGVRHYMYLNDKSKFFVNTQVNVLTLKSGKSKTIDVDYEGYIFDQTEMSQNQAFKSFSFGAGYNYNSKFSIELRYNTNYNILKKQELQTAELSYTSVILGYNLF
ncbi:hypothetical protein [Chryseobacterium sp. 3008163]|uniref:hypothetical protein n=1 Tax=Chryseobacterium sp. 3008163 TaxID=2478663 RepID=UPI000F0CC6A9|nr:hypothetical protein [Chryseobacterium sp. 3008163]AYN01504.1 hypothetical protein EAG08_15390 [Chryseobacterium sp. 3008163]